MDAGEMAAYVCSHLKTGNIDVVLSGAGCVSIYGKNKYLSYDLDYQRQSGIYCNNRQLLCHGISCPFLFQNGPASCLYSGRDQ